MHILLSYTKLQTNKCMKTLKRFLPNLPMLLIVLLPYIYKYMAVGLYMPHLADLFPLVAIFILWHIRGLYRFHKGIRADIPVYRRRLTHSMNNGEKVWITRMDLLEATQYLFELENFLEQTGVVYENKNEIDMEE